jgi:hypothetical protein
MFSYLCNSPWVAFSSISGMAYTSYTIMPHEIVESLDFSLTEILAIEDNELHGTFLYVAFGSQSLLRTTSDLTGPDTNWRTEGGDQRGGVNGSQIKFFCKNRPMSQVQTPKTKTLQECVEHTNQQIRNDTLKVMNVAEKELNQWDTRLAKYGQNSE